MQLGRKQTLQSSHKTEHGIYLIDEEENEVLLPERFIPQGIKKGDKLDVFIYTDNKGRLIATTNEPLIEAGEVATLRIANVSSIGAWADMGIGKELLIPFREQRAEMNAGDTAVVCCYIDEATNRLVGSTKLAKHLSNEEADYQELDEVSVIAWYYSELGLNVIVDGRFIGLIHEDALLGEFPEGTIKRAFIAKQRPDKKLDIVLKKPGFEHIDSDAKRILALLEKENGFLPYTDKSPPETIRSVFDMSKKTFKKAIGGLYKQRVISLEADGIRLVD